MIQQQTIDYLFELIETNDLEKIKILFAKIPYLSKEPKNLRA